MLTTEQLAARKIGGSDAATILGLNPRQTALELYHEKRGELAPLDLSDNEAVEAGNIFEAPIAELTALRLSRMWDRSVKLRRSNVTRVNPKYPWLTVHIDRDVVGEERGVEIKNVYWRMAHLWGEPGGDGIPEYYLPQPHVYMLVTGYPVWTVAAFFGGSELRIYEVERDREMDELIVETTHDFWHKHVLAGVPPPFEFDQPRALEVMRRLHPGTSGEVIAANDSAYALRNALEYANARLRSLGAMADASKAELLHQMGDAAVLTFNDGVTFERKLIRKKPYSVGATEYIDARLKKAKEE